MAYYLPPGLHYASTEGPIADPYVVDWRDGVERLRRGDPAVTVPPLLDRLPVGGHVLVVCPTSGASSALQSGLGEGPGRSQADGEVDEAAVAQTTPVPESVVLFHALHRFRCQQVDAMLLSDPRLVLDRTMVAPGGEVKSTVIDGYLLTKRQA
jgi:hypothetical protein